MDIPRGVWQRDAERLPPAGVCGTNLNGRRRPHLDGKPDRPLDGGRSGHAYLNLSRKDSNFQFPRKRCVGCGISATVPALLGSEP